MKIHLVAAFAVVSVSLAGCVLDPYALNGMNRYDPATVYGYQQQSSYGYQQPNTYTYQQYNATVYQQPTRSYGIGQSRMDVYGAGRRHQGHEGPHRGGH